MKQAPQILFIGMEPSAAVEAAAIAKIEKLDLFSEDLMACRVTIELADKHKRQGRTFNVRVGLTMPGREIVVDRAHDEDLYVAMREAFDDAKRQLEDAVRRVRDQVKQPRAPSA
jgi:ribosomal subunit interface protein